MKKGVSIETIRKANQRMINEGKVKKYDELKAKIEALPRFGDNWQGIDLDPTGDWLDREEVLNLFQ